MYNTIYLIIINTEHNKGIHVHTIYYNLNLNTITFNKAK